ncbi:serine hydrolase [Levilactobacillus brevis]|jgi:CubicO group peptidase (beta-lactamase class C family)|uniref:serine hydrolase n=1 Tax=Levilactobacillus brevis TaxID=1580 RepID=UPI0004637598|nr:serine hydrolase [Levilactobacillus brevis]ARQ92466.1 penicillin-binding protein [Levilactobacillus brevis]KLE30950.1 penicillin-binding protein [Levilactobacillus brevis]KWU40548.1 penicillin-binding protein [Levilactobacillus brevis]MBU5274980.1 class A beta-lactamase-related serine hydrolase [Levilactobacillus brevis]MBX6948100.1 beta-lactamase family protein [Levilactobacillus brevis]
MKKLWFILGGLCVAGGLLSTQPAEAKSYLTITSTQNTSYNARFNNQGTRNDGIYYYAPYYTQRSAKTRDASGKDWQHRFVKVTKVAKLSNGSSFAQFSWYGKAIGWVDQAALQKYSRSQNAAALLKKSHFQGNAMLFNNYATGASHVSVGSADATAKLPNSNTTLFPLASLQKVMTGAIIEQLAASKKLSLNDKLSRYYPSVTNSKNITLRQLLNHRSGIDMDETAPSTVLNTQSAELNYTLAQLKVSGDTSFTYTNANYTLLAAVASKVTGQNYDTLIQNRIIKPLKLTHTYAWNKLPSTSTVANGYRYSNGQDNVAQNVSQKLMSSLLGAGNYYATPSDYYTIQKGLRNGKILTKSQYYDLANDYKLSYAGGLYHYSGGIKRVRGALSGAGYNNILYGSEGNKTGVILFANQSPTRSIDSLAKTLYDLARYYNEN